MRRSHRFSTGVYFVALVRRIARDAISRQMPARTMDTSGTADEPAIDPVSATPRNAIVPAIGQAGCSGRSGGNGMDQV